MIQKRLTLIKLLCSGYVQSVIRFGYVKHYAAVFFVRIDGRRDVFYLESNWFLYFDVFLVTMARRIKDGTDNL